MMRHGFRTSVEVFRTYGMANVLEISTSLRLVEYDVLSLYFSEYPNGELKLSPSLSMIVVNFR